MDLFKPLPHQVPLIPEYPIAVFFGEELFSDIFSE